MGVERKGKLLRIYLNENTKHEKGLLYQAIVDTAFKQGLAGSMVFRGNEGFGFCCAQCRTIQAGMTISPCHPMVIEFIDTEEKNYRFGPCYKRHAQDRCHDHEGCRYPV